VTEVKINIRKASLQDLKATVEIYNQAIRDGKKTAHQNEFSVAERTAWFEKHQSEQFPLFVAELDEAIVGYATLSPYRANRPALASSVEISYYVHFDYHRKGVGDALVKQALAAARNKGFQTVIAILLSGNTASIQLLVKNGFEEWGRLPEIAHFDDVKLDHLYFGMKTETKASGI